MIKKQSSNHAPYQDDQHKEMKDLLLHKYKCGGKKSVVMLRGVKGPSAEHLNEILQELFHKAV